MESLLNKLAARWMSVPPVFIDGILYVLIGVCGFLATVFGTEEAYNLFSAKALFWVKTTNGSLLAGATALKMFRSTAYSDHQVDKAEAKKE